MGAVVFVQKKDLTKKDTELERRFVDGDKLMLDVIEQESTRLPSAIKSSQELKAHLSKHNGHHVAISPVGKVCISTHYAFKHLMTNSNDQNRQYLSGAMIETLKDPLFVVELERDGMPNIAFYKPFKRKEKLLHIVCFASKDDYGNLFYKTCFEISNVAGKITRMLRVKEDKILYCRRHNQRRFDTEEHLKINAASKDAHNEIIPKNIEVETKNKFPASKKIELPNLEDFNIKPIDTPRLLSVISNEEDPLVVIQRLARFYRKSFESSLIEEIEYEYGVGSCWSQDNENEYSHNFLEYIDFGIAQSSAEKTSFDILCRFLNQLNEKLDEKGFVKKGIGFQNLAGRVEEAGVDLRGGFKKMKSLSI